MAEKQQLQFAPFSSILDPGFWYQLTQKKLDVYRLDDRPVKIHGFYANSSAAGLPPFANVTYSAFEEYRLSQLPPRALPLLGYLRNTNTLEDFKNINKQDLINQIGHEMWEDIKSGRALRDPTLLCRFFCLTFADLKSYDYYYWFAFPASCFPENCHLLSPPEPLGSYFTAWQVQQMQKAYAKASDTEHRAFFLVQVSEGSLSIHPLAEYETVRDMPGKVLLGFADPCSLEAHPGWPLRNLLALVATHWAEKRDTWEILCYRERVKDGQTSGEHSIVLRVRVAPKSPPSGDPQFVGWEKNERQKLGPRTVNLSATMDPGRLAESAVDLNLKLMRWRLVPSLDLEKITGTRCLLLGAGTLGCNIARCLLGWGVRTITLVDNGTVSYSNPVRQSLFTFETCLHGGKYKAEAAAESLKAVFPGVKAEGIVMTIPMPGHPISGTMLEKTESDVQRLEALVAGHDVIFLLMDTRESRWLPTVIAASQQKLVINAALGFDTFLVQRHGLKFADAKAASVAPSFRVIPGSHLGCYFCNDVVAPGDSTKDRTLDQQCTVTRPGVSMVAAAFAVEMMVNLLHHADGGLAPAETSAGDDYLSSETASPLGALPHQIRGFLSRFLQVLPASMAFDRCTACSTVVIEEYHARGFKFLLQAFNDSTYLEELTGLKQLHEETDLSNVWALSDDDAI